VVSVDAQTALAVQNSVSQGEVVTLATAGTHLRRRRETIYLDNALAALEGDPFQDAQERSET
jgi:hypothetical protein